MTTRRDRQLGTGPLVGLFGGLGSGNIGNDASMEAILGYLRTSHPEAILDAMCGGPQVLRDRYGLRAVHAHWQTRLAERAGGPPGAAVKALSKAIDAVRIATWVRRHDVVIVPGMGVLESSLPQRPWQFPYTMFVLCLAGRIFGTKVALVGVGATMIKARLTRWLFISAARLASYRSYRDTLSRDAMARQGVSTESDHVYADLAFALPVPACGPGDPHTVGVGVMDYNGRNEDRARAAEIHASYVANLGSFVRWLVDGGHSVRLLVGDANGSDGQVVAQILADLAESRPGLPPGRAISAPAATFDELLRAMAPAGSVVATRYHNVICALMLARPTISIEYSAKNSAVMAAMGVPGYCQSISSLDADLLRKQFADLQEHAAQLRDTIAGQHRVIAQLLARQFAELSMVLFGTAPAAPPGRPAASQGETS
jgi:polysaccharide pyruvyl transferase WcaK-like protein